MNFQYFHEIPFFSNLSDETLEKIIVLFDQVNLKKGDTIINVGDPADGMYVITDGEVEVIIDGAQIANLGTKDFFGELALITKEPRTASVQVTSDTFQAFYLTRDIFESTKNELSDDVKQEILRRIRENFDTSRKII
ncbi:cyclic nucleotide-binding domain-containing protein [Candidatus Pacearchaeota archaeon]|nr:cyclic nucleotide-binding domain-containing protein [Candidatus Pacearchaeota archaeon]